MLLMSLGPAVLVALMQSGHREAAGPDLSWLLFGPDLNEETAEDRKNQQTDQ